MSATALRSAAWDATVLSSCAQASPLCTSVTIDTAAVEAVADWMCFEVFPPIGGDDVPALDRTAQINLTMLLNAINFAYTDFETKVPWSIEVDGQTYVDADGLRLRFEQALAAGEPVTTGQWMAELTDQEFLRIAHGPWPIPMVAERVEVLRGVGRVLVEKYDGSFASFVDSCPDLAYDDGNGLLERVISEFPMAFDDHAAVHGVDVRISKLPQLAVWMLSLRGLKRVTDLDKLSCFADYIIPASLRAMQVFSYSPELAAAIDGAEVVPAGSEWEVEIRVQTVYAIALLTDALNARRVPRGLPPVVNAQVDYRFWAGFHDLMWPHHLTITTKY